MATALPFAVALLAVLALTPPVRRLARRLGFVDRPAARKVHREPVPLGGGVALVAGVVAGLMAGALCSGAGSSGVFPARFFIAAISGLALVVTVGLWDDRAPLKPLVKLGGQFIAALVLVLGSGVPEPAALAGLAVPLFVLGAVGLMNAMNFLDNMDGILAGIALVCGLALLNIAAPERGALAALAAATAGASAGFLAYNFSPARIFMGDAGSLAVGYLFALMVVGLTPPAVPARPIAGLLLVLGFPLFDLTFVTITRMRDHRRVWVPGRDHSTHRLDRLLHSPRRTAVAVYSLTAMMAVIGVLVVEHPGTPTAFLAAAGLVVLLVLGSRLARVPAA